MSVAVQRSSSKSREPEKPGRNFITVDGNEAAAKVAHKTNEVIAIYPITPASPMGEIADAYSAKGQKNLFGTVPDVSELQSEAGAAAACHGALQAGSLVTTFTASQGLLLMIPEMFKIAGELTPAVFHITARTIATHALSIFGDHSDVMCVRSTGWAMLASTSVQECHDMALIAQAATLRSRVPFLHFFDGFRTSHEVNKIVELTPDDMRAMIDMEAVEAHRRRALNPNRPVLRGTAQNPDVFFQAREACNPFYDATPEIVRRTMDQFAQMTGRAYHLFDYVGDPAATDVIVLMGSGAGAAEEAVEELMARGRRVGMVNVHLYRPFDAAAFIARLPKTVQRIAVLDRTKEPGALGEPLYQDVLTALAEQRSAAVVAGLPTEPRVRGQETHAQQMPLVIGGRYGLSSKEFTPSMVVAVFDELKKDQPKRHFTVGIHDDVTNLSLKWDPEAVREKPDVIRAMFYGLGSDGTVGASRNSVKIVGENTPLYAQGYFVYDSRKAGSVTVSHLRFSPRPIKSSYLIDRANFVACNQFNFLERMDMLQAAEPGGTFLLNSPYGPDEVWDHLPLEVQEQIIEKHLKLYVVDAYDIARQTEMGTRINTVMQACFFALSGILPRDEAIAQIKNAIKRTYGKRGQSVVDKNFAAVDASLAGLHEVKVPGKVTTDRRRLPPMVKSESDFVNRVTAALIAGLGDHLPVSAMPADGTFPTGTTKYEKRSIALEIPIWDSAICTDCGMCALVCPHAAIRLKAYPASTLEGNNVPEGFKSKPWKGKELENHLVTVQVAPDDCTGCGVCVDVCPAKSKEEVRHKAINMSPKMEHLEREQKNFDFFLSIPEIDRRKAKVDIIKGVQLLEPLFEFSGACAGCGETPYVKLLSQLFGDRAVISNATGCSSIYGGNLPTTPWSTNPEGRGPAWINSLFEDNAEFGLGMRLAIDQTRETATHLLQSLSGEVGDDLVTALLAAQPLDEAAIFDQRQRVAQLQKRLEAIKRPEARQLADIADVFVPRSVWILGGDGWAYDIGFGGLDHVLTMDRNINLLVLDTGVYSNTGGQASKATPRAAVAKFAASGKPTRKKDLGMLAVSYGNVYVAQIAMGANPAQTLKAFREAESYPGVSLILAYSHCIAQGIDMSTGMSHQKDVVQTGLWPLYRYDPRLARAGEKPFHLDSRKPTMQFADFAMSEGRFAMGVNANPERAKQLFELAQEDIDDQWHYYEQMAGVERAMATDVNGNGTGT
jgi:pyruvate-ferredoxin/flavodoxin oxidoreductase